MRIFRFGNILANPSTNLSARQSFAVESDAETAAKVASPFALLTVAALTLFFWKRK